MWIRKYKEIRKDKRNRKILWIKKNVRIRQNIKKGRWEQNKQGQKVKPDEEYQEKQSNQNGKLKWSKAGVEQKDRWDQKGHTVQKGQLFGSKIG